MLEVPVTMNIHIYFISYPSPASLSGIQAAW